MSGSHSERLKHTTASSMHQSNRSHCQIHQLTSSHLRKHPFCGAHPGRPKHWSSNQQSTCCTAQSAAGPCQPAWLKSTDTLASFRPADIMCMKALQACRREFSASTPADALTQECGVACRSLPDQGRHCPQEVAEHAALCTLCMLCTGPQVSAVHAGSPVRQPLPIHPQDRQLRQPGQQVLRCPTAGQQFASRPLPCDWTAGSADIAAPAVPKHQPFQEGSRCIEG